MHPPPSLTYGFIALTLLTAWWFYRLTGSRAVVGIGFVFWLAVHGVLAYGGFYGVTDTLPPRLALVMVPMLALALAIGFSPLGKSLRADLDLEQLHYVHGIRILVEVVFLHGLFTAGLAAEVVTYEGQNYDLLAGITGPLVGLLVFRLGWLSPTYAIVWNVAGIVSLGWTVSRAVLSAPSPYQQYGFEQPTLAIFYFPFIWLPALVAPLMVWAHCLALGRLLDKLRLNHGGECKQDS